VEQACEVGRYTQPAMTTTKYLFTFGYEGMTVEQFVARAQAAGVRLVVDVRELPLSRKRGFSKTAFRQALAEGSIAYIHMPALGCPKSIRNRYRTDGDWSAYTRAYQRHLKSQNATVGELARIAKATPSCLVCFEADFAMCHRTYVARAVHGAGSPPIVHLSATATVADLGFQAAA
jgi:uncharacterized protein (DUF488 family)